MIGRIGFCASIRELLTHRPNELWLNNYERLGLDRQSGHTPAHRKSESIFEVFDSCCDDSAVAHGATKLAKAHDARM